MYLPKNLVNGNEAHYSLDEWSQFGSAASLDTACKAEKSRSRSTLMNEWMIPSKNKYFPQHFSTLSFMSPIIPPSLLSPVTGCTETLQRLINMWNLGTFDLKRTTILFMSEFRGSCHGWDSGAVAEPDVACGPHSCYCTVHMICSQGPSLFS